MRKEFNSQRIFLEHQYGGRDVMWKLSISAFFTSELENDRRTVKTSSFFNVNF